MQTVSAFHKKSAALLLKLSRRAGFAALAFLVISFALSFRLPWWITWENGPVEMLQNVILLEGFFLCVGYYVRDKKTVEGTLRTKAPLIPPAVWILGALIFLLLFGREISWGRVFFVEYIGRFGPEFTDQSKLSFFWMVKPVVALLIVTILAGFYRWFPRKSVLLQVPFPLYPFAMLCLCSFIALMGDHSVLQKIIGHAPAIAMEECAELAIYYLLVFLTWYYHKWFVRLNKTNRNKTLLP